MVVLREGGREGGRLLLLMPPPPPMSFSAEPPVLFPLSRESHQHRCLVSSQSRLQSRSETIQG